MAVVDLLRSWGVNPSSVVGHSSGEAPAAYAAGALTFKSALFVSYTRGLLSQTLVENDNHIPGAMLATGLSATDIEPYLATLNQGYAVIACINSPSSVTVSGDLAAIDELHDLLQRDGRFARKLKIPLAYHSTHMQAIADEYMMRLGGLKTSTDTAIGYRSSVTGHLLHPSELNASYWATHMKSPVRFVDSLRSMCVGADVDVLLEIGPHCALAGPIRQILSLPELENRNIQYIPTLFRNRDAETAIFNMACALVTAGYPVNLAAINAPPHEKRPRVLVDLPPYPWNHQNSYWHESRLSTNYLHRHQPRHDLLGAPSDGSHDLEPRWRHYIRTPDSPWLRDLKLDDSIIYPSAGFLVMAIEGASQHYRAHHGSLASGYRLRHVRFGSTLVIPDDRQGVEVSLVLRPASNDSSFRDPTWMEFRVLSHLVGVGCREHCYGQIHVERKRRHLEAMGPVDIKPISAQSMKPENTYITLESVGLQVGKAYQSIVDMSQEPSRAVCTTRIPDTQSTMPCRFEYPHVIHPISVEALFHAASLASCGPEGRPRLLTPVAIGEMWVSDSISAKPGDELLAEICIQEPSIFGAQSAVNVVQQTGDSQDVAFEVHDLKLGRVAGPCIEGELEQLSSMFFLDAMSSLDGKEFEPAHQNYVEHMKLQCEHRASEPVHFNGAQRDELQQKLHRSGPLGELLCRFGEHLPQILREEIHPLILTPEDDVWYELYEQAYAAKHMSPETRAYLENIIHRDPEMNILGIGMTPGSTLSLLKTTGGIGSNKARFARYDATSVRTDVLESTATKLGDCSKMVSLRPLDIIHDPESQGYTWHDYDLIVINGIPDLSQNMDDAVANIFKLLSQNGEIIFLHQRRLPLYYCLIFGTLPGWFPGEFAVYSLSSKVTL